MTSAIHALTIPKLGLTMKTGSVAAWRVKPGDEVTEGKPVADIETEKITSEYEAPVSGILRRQVASTGETLPVGALIGVVAAADTPDAEIDAFVTSYRPEQKA
jgi:pyruvate dehydrogenase E2 component (dihydrolipoamide acetyltransferase)